MTSCRVDHSRKPNRKELISTEIKHGEDGNFFVYPTEFQQDFRIAIDDDIVRGEYWAYIQKSRVYPRWHECIEDIISTCTHETLHHCFCDVLYGTHGADPIDMEVWQEHWAIRQTMWADEQFYKEFDLFRNEALREEVGYTNEELYSKK